MNSHFGNCDMPCINTLKSTLKSFLAHRAVTIRKRARNTNICWQNGLLTTKALFLLFDNMQRFLHQPHWKIIGDVQYTPYTPDERERIPWAVLLVPGTCALDALSPQGPGRGCRLEHAARLGAPHKRHPAELATTITLASTTQSTTPAATTPATTTGEVSRISAMSPALPTPFPQPLDDTMDANFSGTRCEACFLDMTAAPAFRECRSFSLLLLLLLVSSSEFTDVCILSLLSLPSFRSGHQHLMIRRSHANPVPLRFVLLPFTYG